MSSIIDSWVIVVVNLNLKNDTTDCIKSLVNSGAALKNIVVVDNGSTDGSVRYLFDMFGEELNIIEAGVNKGYAYGINLGINKGIDLGASWFFLMNNDTLVDKYFFQELAQATQSNPIYGLYGPLILYYSQPEVVWYLGDHLISGTLITVNPFRGKKSSDFGTATIPVDFVHGCGMLVRRDVIEKIGKLDDSSLIYGEEIDFVWRARLAGFKALGVPGAKMWHKISAIMGKQKPKTRYLRIRNQIRFYKRYSRGFLYPIMFLFSTGRCMVIGVKDIIQGNLGLLKPMVDGWIHGWFGNHPSDI